MAGKFLTLDEAAERLGVSLDEVHKLIDRKELYPLRDGNTLKFKQDDIERFAMAAADSVASGDSGLSLDLDDEQPKLSGVSAISGVELSGGLDLGDGLQLDDDDVGKVTGSGGGLSLDDGLSLGIESNANAISAGAMTPAPSAAASGSGAAPTPEPITGTLPIDLSGIDLGNASGAGSNATGSLVMGSNAEAIDLSGSMSNVGSALSGALEGGLSLEDSGARASGVLSAADFEEDMQSAINASAAGKSGLAGEDIEEFDPVPDDESGSDVVADDSEAASSSFLPDDGSSSMDLDAGGDFAGAAAENYGPDAALVVDTSFSVWQVCGLVCCALLMLTGGLVMFDLVQTLGTSDDLSLSSPLLNPLADLFGWRK